MTFADFEKALLALTMWREARGEGRQGMRAVGHVIANRVSAKGKTWAQVMECKWQFSSLTALGDSQTIAFPSGGDNAFIDALSLADEIYSGSDFDITNGAQYYANLSVLKPDNAFLTTVANNPAHPFTVKIGNHSFYK